MGRVSPRVGALTGMAGFRSRVLGVLAALVVTVLTVSTGASPATASATSHPRGTVTVADLTVAGAKAATTVTARVSPPVLRVHGTALLSATVSAGSGGTPSGVVAFTDAAGKLCAAKLANGVAQCHASFSGVGTYAITASYAGDAAHRASSGTGQLLVAQGETTTSVAAKTVIALAHVPVTLSARVSSPSGVPSGM